MVRGVIIVCCLIVLLLPGAGAIAQEKPAKLQVSSQHPRLLINQTKLDRLRELAAGRGFHWRRLLAWALEPARKGALPHDGPGLALAALILKEDDKGLADNLGKLAVKCAIRGARFGGVQSINDRSLLSKEGNKDPLELLKTGYNLLRPNAATGPYFQVARYTASEISVKAGNNQMSKAAKPGDTYALVMNNLPDASWLVRQIALTLDWAWDFFDEKQRQGVALWLIAQAGAFKGRALGCFDTDSAAALSLCTLAGLAAHGSDPQAEELLQEAWQVRFQKHMSPCLKKLGHGGGWFEGNIPGARAGLDLVFFAGTIKSAAAITSPYDNPWFKDRLSYLLFNLLPGLEKSPAGNYRVLAPGGDALYDPVLSADLVRMQMLALMALMPGNRAAGTCRALLMDSRTPGLLAGQRYVYDFLWLDPAAPTSPLATASLSNKAQDVGQTVMLSDWSERGSWLAFSCGPHFAERQHLDAGTIMLYRQGFLLPQGGGYDGETTLHAANYGIRSVAANTVLVYDPEEYSWYDMRAGKQPKDTYSNDGGQRSWSVFNASGAPAKSAPWTASGLEQGEAPWVKLGDIYNVAKLEAQEDQARYSYAKGDAGPAYQGSTHKIKRFKRHVFLLRSNGPDDAEAAEAIVIADDVELAKKGLSVHFVLHFQEQPATVGELKKLGPGRWRGRASPLVTAAGSSRLDVIPVWPPEGRMDIIGGPGVADCWVGTRNYPPRPPAVNPAPWRAEYVSSDNTRTGRPMLHVLLPADMQAPAPPVLEPVKSDGNQVMGVHIKDPSWPRLVVIKLEGGVPEEPVSYLYPTGRSRHLVAGLKPRTEYKVTVGDLKVTIAPGKGMKSSPAGLLAFKVAPAPEKKTEDKKVARPRVQQEMK